jgi:hypothetical protein
LAALLKYRAENRREAALYREERLQKEKDFAANPDAHICELCGAQNADVRTISEEENDDVNGTLCEDCYSEKCYDI